MLLFVVISTFSVVELDANKFFFLFLNVHARLLVPVAITAEIIASYRAQIVNAIITSGIWLLAPLKYAARPSSRVQVTFRR